MMNLAFFIFVFVVWTKYIVLGCIKKNANPNGQL